MAPASKKRKLAATTTTSPKAPFRYPQISDFGKISKSVVAVPSFSKKAISTSFKEIDNDLIPPRSNRKRKFGAIDKVESACGTTRASTKGARGLLDTLSFESASSCPSSPLSHCFENRHHGPESANLSTSPPSSQGSEPSEQLPQDLQDLIDLHSSVLSALSLHFAHHSQDTPADLRCLTPTISRLWKRRAVEVKDVQRVLALAQSPHLDRNDDRESTRLSLCDYGKGKVCIEIRRNSTGRSGHGRPIEDEVLKEMFETNLWTRWKAHQGTFNHGQRADPTLFITLLPLASIIIPKSVAKCNPLLAKGQRRLEDLLRRPSPTPTMLDTSSGSTAGTQTNSLSQQSKPSLSRQSSLLSRIKAKETLQTSLPAPLSLPEMQRQDAIRRLEEIIPVFECLSSSHLQTVREGESVGRNSTKLAPQTLSFTKSTLITNLQQSMGNPISKDDASRSIDVLGEMAPGWVIVRKIGKLESVTFRAVGGESRGKLMENIRLALGDGL